MSNENWPVQIDPDNCGCTECIIGQYVPLNAATEEQILRAARGELSNATGYSNEQLYSWTSTPAPTSIREDFKTALLEYIEDHADYAPSITGWSDKIINAPSLIEWINNYDD